MINADDLNTEVLSVLKNSHTGKSDPPVRHFISAYQILNRLPTELREELRKEHGFSGKNSSRGTGDNDSASKRISASLRSLVAVDAVEVIYIDARGIQFYIEGESFVESGYPVIGMYRAIV